jgi:hypothetical protein
MSAIANQLEKDQRIKLVEAHVNAENNHDINGIMETFGSGSKFFLNGMTVVGADGIRALYESFGFGGNAGFSEIKANAKEWHIGDESITLELVLSGVHTNEWQGIPATGRKFEVPVCAIFCFDDKGTLESERVYFDMNLVLKQLGVIEG